MGADFSLDCAEYDNGWGEYANGVERNSESEKHEPRTAKNFFASATAANKGKWDADFDRASYTNHWGSYREGKNRYPEPASQRASVLRTGSAAARPVVP